MKDLGFINRKKELQFLKDALSSGERQLLVIYGRRRVGKSRLITFFSGNKPHIYFLADKRGTESNVRRFAEKCGEYFNEPPPAAEDFAGVFKYLMNRVGEKPFIVAMDEFSYLVEKDDSVPSVFQRAWDEVLPGTKMCLILCGSSISMMYEGALSRSSPLYGRKTGHWKVLPMRFADAMKFFPDAGMEKAIQLFSVFGGIPAYLAEADGSKSIEWNIEQVVLKKGAPLYEEPEFLLRQELRDPSTYSSILEAMAANSKLTDIANKAGVKATDFPKYFAVLENLELVEREIQVTEKESKRALYKMSDNFFSFWFRFAFPRKSELEEGRHTEVLEKTMAVFNQYVGRAFEEVCRQALEDSREAFPFTKIGKWWGSYRDGNERKTSEMDIVALNEPEKGILFAECKWSENVDAPTILAELKKKAELVEWNGGKRKEKYAIFAKSFGRRTDEEGVLLFDLKDLDRIFRKAQGE